MSRHSSVLSCRDITSYFCFPGSIHGPRSGHKVLGPSWPHSGCGAARAPLPLPAVADAPGAPRAWVLAAAGAPKAWAFTLLPHQASRCYRTELTACAHLKRASCRRIRPLHSKNNNKEKNQVFNLFPPINILRKPFRFLLTNSHLLVAEGFVLFILAFGTAALTCCLSSHDMPSSHCAAPSDSAEEEGAVGLPDLSRPGSDNAWLPGPLS